MLFYELSTCRPLGAAGPGPIPATAIWQAEDRYPLPAWTAAAIYSLDAAYLTLRRKAAPIEGS